MSANPATSTAGELPPQDIQAEVSVLGSMILDAANAVPKVRAVLGDNPEPFYRPAHQTLYRTILARMDRGEPLDLVLLKTDLERTQELQAVGGMDYVVALADGLPDAGNAEFYARIVRDAADKRALIQEAARLLDEARQPGTQSQAILDGLQDRLLNIGRGPGGDIGPGMTAGDILAKFPTQGEPIIDRIIRRREVGNLVSLPKLNKSWTVLHAALCIVDGRDFLGFPVHKGRVLLLDFELHPGTLAKRLQAVASAMGLDAQSIGNGLTIHCLRGKRLDVYRLGRFLASIKPREYAAVILDPIYKTYPAGFDENSNVAMGELYGAFQAYADRLDSAWIAVHHATKGSQADKGVTDVGSGGGSQSRSADVHIILRPHKEDGAAVLAGVLRSFPPFAPIPLRWRYPLWELAPDLDPADLYRAPRRGGRQATEKAPPVLPPVRAEESPIGFAVAFLSPEPKPRDSIIGAALSAGLTERRAGNLLKRLEADGKAHRWTMGKDRRAHYANRPQPKLTEDGK